MYRAIVLKNYFPKKNKVMIFHEQFGKINFFINEKHQAAALCNGSLMYCDVIKKNRSYQCDFIDPYFVPFDHTLYDLYFIHDVLRICINFMPDQTCMKDVFDIIITMYEQIDILQTCHKKIFLLKLFLFLGIFPENKKLYQYVMQDNTLHSHDTDLLLQQSLKYCWQTDVNYS